MVPARYRKRGIPTRFVLNAATARHRIGDKTHEIALPITLTPFASSKPCSARCHFCSENLLYREATRLSASLRTDSTYGSRLRNILKALGKIPFGLSLSGLEATYDIPWLLDLIAAFCDHEKNGGRIEERVLYSNGTGLTDANPLVSELRHALERLRLSRIELSRHSFDESRNDAIMRFRPGIAVRTNEHFESMVRRTLPKLPIRLVCVLQKGGVETIAAATEYLKWAERLGISCVVFRELSRLHDLYQPNATYRYIEQSRVGIEPLIDSALLQPNSFEPLEIKEGYYYWNMRFTWNRRISVIFETSDYLRMKTFHRSDVVHKLVFHANGNLCADWDPNTRVLISNSG